MNSDKLIKLGAGVGLFGAWLTLVILKMTPPGEFVNALQLALMALGIYHASTNGSAPATDSDKPVLVTSGDVALSKTANGNTEPVVSSPAVSPAVTIR